MLRIWVVVVALSATAVAGPPPLETQSSGALSIGLPKGWKVQSQGGAATIFVAQQDPAKADSAAVLVTVQPTGNKTTEDQLLDVVAKQVAKDIKVVKREALAGGGHVLIADGTAGTVKVRVGAIAVAQGDGAIMGVLVAKPGEFDGLGGTTLLVSILGSIKVAQAAPAAPQPAAVSSGKITIPDLAGVWDNDSASTKQYANSSGQYAGASTVSMHKIYTVAANGDYTEKFSGYSGGTATGGGRFSWQDYSGKWSFTPQGTLEMTEKGYASSYYTIVSMTTADGVTTLMLAGPQYKNTDPPDARCPCEKLYRKNVKKK